VQQRPADLRVGAEEFAASAATKNARAVTDVYDQRAVAGNAGKFVLFGA
jgi:hypothetical protein